MAVQTINHIDVTPGGYLGGAPRIAGKRISVHHLVVMTEHLGVSADEILDQYNLTPGQLYAALSYYYDHREEIDRLIAHEETLLEKARSTPASLQEARIRAMWQDRQSTRRSEGDGDSEMTVKEIAGEFGVDESTVREAAKKGWIPARKSGATWLIHKRDAYARWGERRGT
jgi:excisionase family DNA binding protein